MKNLIPKCKAAIQRALPYLVTTFVFLLIILFMCIALFVFRSISSCPECGHYMSADHREGAMYCEQCGSPLSDKAPAETEPTCAGCGEVCDTPYCRFCGHKANTEEQQ